jgi:hypothetical protein
MTPIYTTRSPLPADEFGLSRRLYRIFLLSILFGVLWIKGFLWSAFIVALILYLLDTVVLPALAMQAVQMPEAEDQPEAEPEPPPRRGGGRGRWKWPPEESPSSKPR